MAGVVPAGTGIASCESTFVDNLQVASKLAADSDIQLLLEPLNARDTPGYLITGTASARRLIERIGAHNVRLQYDFYHLQIMQGDLAAGVRDNLDLIGHIQFSSVPGRHEPQYGEVNLPFLFEFLDTIGYQGWVGCEYRARTTTRDGLTWTKGPHIRFA
jgi:hydroxypyruvate isomerase